MFNTDFLILGYVRIEIIEAKVSKQRELRRVAIFLKKRRQQDNIVKFL